MENCDMARVLVTGGTGFVGAHCLVQLLGVGYETRATVRDLAREGDVGERLTLFCADLNADAGWAPRSPREAVLATARSLLELGLLKGVAG
jgi:nucleoside-diphosphate-sugar epimerase